MAEYLLAIYRFGDPDCTGAVGLFWLYHPEKPESGFNMTAFALRLSGHRNAVSRRHAKVSRQMWRSLWPDLPENEVPIDYVTNGVHVPTWIEPKISLLLDPSVLTIGFARRFATYKRALLIFKDRRRPIQIIFAGKAHPSDDPGKRVLQTLIHLARDPELGGRIAFVEDYGERLAQYLVHGVDIWLNTPLPPFEACGTSGMKAALNGVPHLSVLDGWWEEGFNGKNGWGIAHEETSDNLDDSDAQKIYHLLEEEIIPKYYSMSGNSIPHEWVKLMKESMKSNAAGFSARRMVKQYVEKFYYKSIQIISNTHKEDRI